jgi:hypothetical protein
VVFVSPQHATGEERLANRVPKVGTEGIEAKDAYDGPKHAPP